MSQPISQTLKRKFFHLVAGLSDFFASNLISYIPSHHIRHFFYTFFFNIEIHPKSTIHMGTKFFGVIPKPVRIFSEKTLPVLKIGEGSSIGDHCFLDYRGTITIGKKVNISSQAMIFTMDHDPQDPRFGTRSAPVVIEDYVWLSTRSMILPGITVGRGAVVAAGAVVTRDVLPFTIVGGVPAKKIGERSRDLQYDVNFRGFLK